MNKYVHLNAEVNGSLLDVLVAVETFNEPQEANGDMAWFFPVTATNFKNYGEVEIIGGDYLPDVIGD